MMRRTWDANVSARHWPAVLAAALQNMLAGADLTTLAGGIRAGENAQPNLANGLAFPGVAFVGRRKVAVCRPQSHKMPRTLLHDASGAVPPLTFTCVGMGTSQQKLELQRGYWDGG